MGYLQGIILRQGGDNVPQCDCAVKSHMQMRQVAVIQGAAHSMSLSQQNTQEPQHLSASSIPRAGCSHPGPHQGLVAPGTMDVPVLRTSLWWGEQRSFTE